MEERRRRPKPICDPEQISKQTQTTVISAIRGIPLDQSSLKEETRSALIACLCKAKGLPFGRGKKFVAKIASQTTLGACMDNFDAIIRVGGTRYKTAFDCFLKQLVNLGLHHLDWERLPPESAHHLLTKIGANRVRILDIRVLKAFTPRQIEKIRKMIAAIDPRHEEGSTITIQDLIDNITLAHLRATFTQSIDRAFVNARNLLNESGFGTMDGIFFEEDNPRLMEEDLPPLRQKK
jgi:hypothetical protein